MTLSPLIQWQNAALKIPDQPPVELGTLELSSQQRVGLLGPSGVGKTTMLRCLAGLSDPTPNVLFKGKSIKAHQWALLRSKMIYLHQQSQFPAPTIEENLKRAFIFKANEKLSYSPETAQKLMQRLKLDHLPMTHPVENLSQGERQRLSLIRALLLKPSVLLLDEPTSALDSESAKLVEDLILQWGRKPNRAFVLISHDLHQIKRMTNSRWWLESKEGRRTFHAE